MSNKTMNPVEQQHEDMTLTVCDTRVHTCWECPDNPLFIQIKEHVGHDWMGKKVMLMEREGGILQDMQRK